MPMTPTPNPTERINELEREVKSLTRLVKEVVAKEKLTSTRLAMVAKDLKNAEKTLKAMTAEHQKTTVKVNQVHAQVQNKKA